MKIKKSENLFKKLSLLLIILLISSSYIQAIAQNKNNDNEAYLSYRNELTNIKEKRSDISKKIASAKQKEFLALSKLQRTQRELLIVQSSYNGIQKNIALTENKISTIRQNNNSLQKEIDLKAAVLGDHLKQIYIKKGNILLNFLDMLAHSDTIIDFLNTLYYQKKLISQEIALIKSIKEKQEALKNNEVKLREQKQNLEVKKEESNKLRAMVYMKKKEQFELVNRLRKERLAYETAERQLEKESGQLIKEILRLSQGDSLDLSDLVARNFMQPCGGAITSPFGYRRHPVFRVTSFHSGIDFGARYGSPIKASNGGIVIYSGWYSGYGNTVIVSHGSKQTTLYAHMKSTAVSAGDKVAQGSIIGYIGSTGISTGPHLHFEYRKNGKPVDPMVILR